MDSSSRPSPSASATLFKDGATKKGNDGNLWRIVKNKNGIKRWAKVVSKADLARETKRIGKVAKNKPKAANKKAKGGYKLDRLEWVRKNARKLSLLHTDPSGPIEKNSHDKLMKMLLEMGDVWENVTRRNQDIVEAELKTKKSKELIRSLVWYYSDEARALLTPYLVEIIRGLLK